jgi:hypothetical protein
VILADTEVLLILGKLAIVVASVMLVLAGLGGRLRRIFVLFGYLKLRAVIGLFHS